MSRQCWLLGDGGNGTLLHYGMFLLFGAAEVFACGIFIFVMFGFPLKENQVSILLLSLLHAIPSYYLRGANLNILDMVVHGALGVTGLLLIIRIPLLYAVLVVVVGYVSYLALQFLLIFCLGITGIVTGKVLEFPPTGDTFIVQGLTVGLVLLLSWLICKKRLHFCFIPDRVYIRVHERRESTRLLILAIVTFGIMLLELVLIFQVERIYVFLPVSLVSFLLLFVFIRLFVNREMRMGRREDGEDLPHP